MPASIDESGHALVSFLVRHAVLDCADVVGRNLRVVPDTRTRFTLHAVEIDGGRVTVVKSARSEPGRLALGREAALLAEALASPDLRRIAPRPLAFDGRFLALEPLHALDSMERDLPATALGETLRKLHRTPMSSPMPPAIPALLHLGAAGTNGLIQRIRTLFPDASHIQSAARLARSHWRAAARVHGDVKWEHCMVREASATPQCLVLVDWELAGRGDVAWDIASALDECIRWGGAGAVGRFAEGYLGGAAGGRLAPSVIERLLAYMGLRAVQTAMELAAGGASRSAVQSAVRVAEERLELPGRFIGPLLG